MIEAVLITGGSGFLGYHIIQSALEKGLDVYAAIRKNSNIEHLKNLPVRYLFLNYEDQEDITRQLREHNINFIIHAAGDTKAPSQEVYNKVNSLYTLNLAKAAENLGSGFKKLVFISSLAAVGPLTGNNETITEETEPNPVTAYGRSKLLAEKGLTNIAIPTIILRPTAIYGPRDKNIFIMVKLVSKGIDPFIGNFLQQLSFVHAKDVADLSVASLFRANAVGAYNISDGKSYNRYQFSDIIKTLLNRRAVRFHIPMPLVKSLAFFLETVNSAMGKPSVISREKLYELAAKNWVCDITRAKNELAFIPKFDLQTGLENSVSWYKENKWI